MDDLISLERAVALLEIYRRTLAYCLHEQAKFGSRYVPPNISQSIAEARENIRQIKRILHAHNQVVVDWPNDAAPDPICGPESLERKPLAGAEPGALLDPLAELRRSTYLGTASLDAGIPTDDGQEQHVEPGVLPSAPPPTDDVEPPIARNLPNYQLFELVTQNDLVVIYRAMQLEPSRPVHVHILRSTDDGTCARFLERARLAQQLNHPNMMRVLDAGRDQQLGAYLVTPQIRCRSLKELLANGPLELWLTLRIFSQISAALDALHAQGIIHADVRPEHILITPDGLAYLTSLHHAIILRADAPADSAGGDGQSAGPASDQPTEQRVPSPESDLTCLGGILYQMLRRMPSDPEHPATPAVRLDPALAGAEAVVQNLLAPLATQRYTSAGQAVAALRQALPQQVVELADYMHETRWEAFAHWTENPLEAVHGDLLAKEFLIRSRARADMLHRVGAVQQLLDRQRSQRLLRRAPGVAPMQIDYIVSYNLYFYELRMHYETRAAPQIRERPLCDATSAPSQYPPDLWGAPVPYVEPFVDVRPEPCSAVYLRPCDICKGTTEVICSACGGYGLITQSRWVTYIDGTTSAVSVQEDCATCRAQGHLRCVRCAGAGQLVYEQTFTWSRWGRCYFNADDLSGIHMHRRAIARYAQQVFRGPVDPYDPRWYQTAPLQELFVTAINSGGSDSRPIAAELIIRGVPITEVDYHREHTRSFILIGFDNAIRGNLAVRLAF